MERQTVYNKEQTVGATLKTRLDFCEKTFKAISEKSLWKDETDANL